MAKPRRTVADIRAAQPDRACRFSPASQIVQDLAQLQQAHQTLSVTLAALTTAVHQYVAAHVAAGGETTPALLQLVNVAIQGERVIQEM